MLLSSESQYPYLLKAFYQGYFQLLTLPREKVDSEIREALEVSDPEDLLKVRVSGFFFVFSS